MGFNPVYALLGFLFRVLLDLDRIVAPREEQQVDRAQERQPARMGAWVGALVGCFLPVTPVTPRRLWVLKKAKYFPFYIIGRTFRNLDYPGMLDRIDLPIGYLLGVCVLLAYLLTFFEDVDSLIWSSRAAGAPSFFLDKFILILQVFSGVMLSVAASSSLEVFIMLCVCIVWGTEVEMVIDIPTPLNLPAMFLLFSYAPLVPIVMADPSLWYLGLIPVFLFLICTVFQCRYMGVVFPVA